MSDTWLGTIVMCAVILVIALPFLLVAWLDD